MTEKERAEVRVWTYVATLVAVLIGAFIWVRCGTIERLCITENRVGGAETCLKATGNEHEPE